jgi:hypothetical protein
MKAALIIHFCAFMEFFEGARRIGQAIITFSCDVFKDFSEFDIPAYN